MLIDTHCHLTHAKFADDLGDCVARAQAAGIQRALLIGTGMADAAEGAKIQQLYPHFFNCAAGLDPFTCFDRHERFADDLAALKQHLTQHTYLALGEIGLEYYHDVLPKSEQAACMAAQLALAAELQLPVIIHCRDAHPDMQAQLAEHPQVSGVIHSFDGEASDAAAYLEMGWYISLNGMVTFKKKEYLREAARIVPLDRLLVETDSPYLAPVPVRGKRCEPAFVAHTAQALAELRGEALADLQQHTTDNAIKLFQFPGLA